MWYLILLIVVIPFKIKIINVSEQNKIKVRFLFFNLNLDQNDLRNRFKENKPTFKQVLNYLSLSNFLGDLIRKIKIKDFKIIKYVEDSIFYETYPIITYYLFTSMIEGWLINNHKNYHFQKMLIANNDRSDYDFYLLLEISMIKIIYCAIKNLKDIARFMKKERLINGS